MILYIDTSSNYLYTGIVNDNKLICEIKKEYGHTLSEYALPEIISMFEKNNINANEIKEIIVVDGPGSFTGIRIGITIAKVYAWSLNIEIKTVNSLEVMAISNTDKKYKIPLIDARRGYIYSAIYDEKIRPIMEPQHIKFVDLKQKIEASKEYVYISNDNFSNLDNVVPYSPDILKIVNYCKNKKSINPHYVNPEYFKLTEAEENQGQ